MHHTMAATPIIIHEPLTNSSEPFGLHVADSMHDEGVTHILLFARLPKPRF